MGACEGLEFRPDRASVVVGVTGTLANLAALHVAAEFARDWRRPLVAVLARGADDSVAADRLRSAFTAAFGGAPVDLDLTLAVVAGRPLHVLLAASGRPGDLLVIGASRPARWSLRPALSSRCERLCRQLIIVPKPPLLRELGQLRHIRDLDGLTAL